MSGISADLICVPPELKKTIWPLVSDRLRKAYLRTDLTHTSRLENDVLNGDGVMWLACSGSAIEAAAVTVLVRTDRHLVCILTALGGEGMSHWLPLLEKIEEWAKAEGAALVRIYGRPGWVRILRNYRVSNVVLERVL